MKDTILNVTVILVIICVLGGVGVGLWMLQRKVHYVFAYEALVQQTVCETVKPEYLVPGKCE